MNKKGSTGIQGVDTDPSWKRQKFVCLNKIVAPLPGRVTPEILLNHKKESQTVSGLRLFFVSEGDLLYDLDLLFVAPEWQGKGVATALVGTVLNELHGLQKPILKSRYMLGNEASRAWHQRFGFTEEVDLFLVRHYYYHALHEWERHEALGDLDEAALSTLAAQRDRWAQLLDEVEEQAKVYGIRAVMPGVE